MYANLMKVTVIGAAKSGSEAAKLAKRKGYDVFVTESAVADKFQTTIKEFDELGIDYEFGGNTNKCFTDCELIITSPGVPPHTKVIQTAEAKNIKIISELEFAFNYIKNNKVIAITGTNGKTTTTSLIHFILENSGKKSLSLGNIGTPLSKVVDNLIGDEILVIEVSSYQLDRIDKFKPDIAIILNITPDHLAYHGTYEQYVDAKWKITKNQSIDNLLILNKDDQTLGGTFTSNASKAYFSIQDSNSDIYIHEEKLVISDLQHKTKEELMLTREMRLPGTHNLYNAMAAILACRRMEIRNEDIRDALTKFSGVEHRLEFVRNIDGVDYVNDSKATNINATWYALGSYKRPIVWIAGGQGDNNDYSSLDEIVKQRVKSIICIGDEAEAIYSHFSTFKSCQKATTFNDAILLAKESAFSGDVVLFTPACKSFDMFANYEHRGNVFKEIVNSLL